MKVNELAADSKVVNLIVKIVALQEMDETPNGQTVQECIIEDETGKAKLTLWNDQAGEYREGEKIMISTGWCKMFRDELQVSTGKFGKIVKVPESPEA